MTLRDEHGQPIEKKIRALAEAPRKVARPARCRHLPHTVSLATGPANTAAESVSR
jgi:hypothetical protein